jgi:hypothetical protein
MEKSGPAGVKRLGLASDIAPVERLFIVMPFAKKFTANMTT